MKPVKNGFGYKGIVQNDNKRTTFYHLRIVRLILSLGRLILSLGRLILSLGRLILSLGRLILSLGRLILSLGRFLQSGCRNTLDINNINDTYCHGESFLFILTTK